MSVRKFIKAAIPLLIFIGLAIFLAIGLTKDPRVVPSPFIQQPAPDFRLANLFSDGQITQGIFISDTASISLLNVWASWCPECWREHDFLMQLAKAGVSIIGLNYKDETAKAKAMLEKVGNPFQIVAVDKLGKTAIDYGVYGAPETFLISNQGIILHKKVGGLNAEIWQREFLPIIQKYIQNHAKP